MCKRLSTDLKKKKEKNYETNLNTFGEEKIFGKFHSSLVEPNLVQFKTFPGITLAISESLVETRPKVAEL